MNTTNKIQGWHRGDVVSITDPAHPETVCVLTTDAAINEPATWLLVDATCQQWRGTEWVESRSPVLLVSAGRQVVAG